MHIHTQTRQTCAFIHIPSQYFGEIALIKSVARTATVTTNTRCVILSITKENFRQFFAANPQARADFEVSKHVVVCVFKCVCMLRYGLFAFSMV